MHLASTRHSGATSVANARSFAQALHPVRISLTRGSEAGLAPHGGGKPGAAIVRARIAPVTGLDRRRRSAPFRIHQVIKPVSSVLEHGFFECCPDQRPDSASVRGFLPESTRSRSRFHHGRWEATRIPMHDLVWQRRSSDSGTNLATRNCGSRNRQGRRRLLLCGARRMLRGARHRERARRLRRRRRAGQPVQARLDNDGAEIGATLCRRSWTGRPVKRSRRRVCASVVEARESCPEQTVRVTALIGARI